VAVVPPPHTLDELRARAEHLAGFTLAELAERLHFAVPPDHSRHKGWGGQLLEAALGASASGRAEPDFPHLGVELKTLPVRPDGRPLESTWVCVAPLDGSLPARWEDSLVRRKLACVLFVPVVCAPEAAPGARVVGFPALWRPNAEEEALLAADYQRHVDTFAAGRYWQVDARQGEALQVRPKAASGAERAWVINDDGDWAQENPRGFYLRARFTGALLARAREEED
jgi:DNA mismatch repair protein MutH